ncbi:MAG: hypothetical protein U5P41_01995 [Gammaproteobacteria bacterium]|nr:hypothetical protein [Gammaproteobacteria bacterium]
MRPITKLTKKFARSRSEWKAETTSGICITKLVVDNFKQSKDREDLSLRETWVSIKSSLDKSTIINHPVLNSSLADEGDIKVNFFNDCLTEALNKLNPLDGDDCSKEEALRIWNDVFSTNYFTDNDGNGGGKDGSQ